MRQTDALFCHQYSGQQQECVHLGGCSIRPVWRTLNRYVEDVLERVSLADLLVGEAESVRKVEQVAQACSSVGGVK